MRKVYFRADASPTIGYGHFIRSLALADMLRSHFDCTIFTCSPTDEQVSQAEGICRLVSLSGESAQSGQFLEMLDGTQTVVLDNYFYTSDYEKAVKDKGCSLVSIDDMHDRHFFADAVINHGFSHEDSYSREDYTRLCLGPQWALLRRPFLEARRDHSPAGKMSRVAICFGGGDPLGLSARFAEALSKRAEISEIRTVLGMSGKLTASQMAELFSWCDLAVVSMSSVCLEALACGAAVAAGWYVDNQKEGYDNFTARNMIYGLGYLGNGIPDTEEIIKTISKTALSPSPIDGKGIRERYIELLKTL